MKCFDIRICGRQPNMVEAMLRIAVCRAAATEKEKRLLGEVIYSVLETVPEICALIIPSQGLTREQVRKIKGILSVMSGSYEWEQLMDKINNKPFTVREAEVIPLLCSGFTARQIADKLGIGFHYVREIIKILYEKTNCNNKTEFIEIIKKRG